MHKIRESISFWRYLVKTSLKASFNQRKKAFFEITLMLISRFFLIAVWFIFFNYYKDINGWELKDIAILLAVIAGSYGILHIFFGGFYHIPRMIFNGELDSYLIQPKNVLWSVVLSKSLLRGWGDIIYAFILIPFAKLYALKSIVLLIIGIISSCLVCLSINIVIISLAFWVRSWSNIAQKYYMTLLIFCSYPTNIYSGFLKIILFSVIPAGIMGFLPVELVKNFSWKNLVILIISSSFYVLLANKFFLIGLRRYVSGSSFNIR